MLSHVSKPTLSNQALCKIALKAGVCQEYSTSSCNFHNEKNNHCCHTMWLTKTLVKYVFCVSGLYSEEFQGAMLVQTCSKIFALNSPTSNCPGILDAKHKKVFCDAKDWKAPVVMWGFLERVREPPSPPKMNGSEFLKHRRQDHSRAAHSRAAFTLLSTALDNLFPSGQSPKACLIKGMLCHYKQAWLVVSLQDWDKSS